MKLDELQSLNREYQLAMHAITASPDAPLPNLKDGNHGLTRYVYFMNRISLLLSSVYHLCVCNSNMASIG
jgi:hypothetical protein